MACCPCSECCARWQRPRVARDWGCCACCASRACCALAPHASLALVALRRASLGACQTVSSLVQLQRPSWDVACPAGFCCRGPHCDTLLSIPWHIVMFDEGHLLKNPETKVGAGAVFCNGPRPGCGPVGFHSFHSRAAPRHAGLPVLGPKVTRSTPPAPHPLRRTQRYQAAERLPTRLRYALTGTPFQVRGRRCTAGAAAL